MRRSRWIVAMTGVALGSLAGSGCTPPPKVAPAAVALSVDTHDPASVAKAVLEALAGELQAIAARRPADAAGYRAFIAERLLNFDAPLRNKATEGIGASQREKTLADFKDAMISHWGSIVAYYIEGLKWETLRIEPAPAGELGARLAYIAAENHDRKTWLRIVLRENEDGAWFPFQIFLERTDQMSGTRATSAPVVRPLPGPIPTTAPASAPTSQP